MGWIELAQDREYGDQPSGSLKLLGISLMSAQLAASQEPIKSMSTTNKIPKESQFSPTQFHPKHPSRYTNKTKL
jgi:hypothetical protein